MSSLSVFLFQYNASLKLAAIRLHIRSPTPQLYLVEVNGATSTAHVTFVSHLSLCSMVNVTCSVFTSAGNTVSLILPDNLLKEVMNNKSSTIITL